MLYTFVINSLLFKPTELELLLLVPEIFTLGKIQVNGHSETLFIAVKIGLTREDDSKVK